MKNILNLFNETFSLEVEYNVVVLLISNIKILLIIILFQQQFEQVIKFN
jgi:hypothetical protein